jgi:hypothetical protein
MPAKGSPTNRIYASKRSGIDGGPAIAPTRAPPSAPERQGEGLGADRAAGPRASRDQVRSAPAWDSLALADQASEEQLHRHFGWPGYGWRPEG